MLPYIHFVTMVKVNKLKITPLACAVKKGASHGNRELSNMEKS